MGYIFPMGYFLAGCFRNEFQNNSNALGNVSFKNLEDMYDYHATVAESVIAMLVIGGAYRIVWLFVLKIWEIMKRREVLMSVGAAKHRANTFLTAGVRWRQLFGGRSSTVEEDVLAQIDSAMISPSTLSASQQPLSFSSHNDL